MASGTSGGSSEADGIHVALVGGGEGTREVLADELATSQSVGNIETAAPAQIVETLRATDPGGIVCLPALDQDSEDSDGDRALLESVVAAASVADVSARDCPVVAVSADIDAAAAYRAGVTDIVPLSAGDATELVVDRVVDILQRHHEGVTAASSDTEQKSKHRQRLTEALATSSPDYAFVCDEEGQYLNVMMGQRSGEQVFDEEELVGRTVQDVFDTAAGDHIVWAIQEALATNEVQTVEYRLDRQEVAWYQARVAPVTDLYENRSVALLVASDITERREREHALEDAKRRFDAVFNAPSALVTILDTDGRIREISDAAVALVEESADAICGRALWEGPWFEGDPDLQTRLETAVERALGGESAQVEAVVPLPDTDLVIDARFEPITDEAGQLTGVLGIARDITRQYRGQRIRQELLSTTQELMTGESRGQLARTVSEAAGSVLGHELHVVYLDDGGDGEPLAPAAWCEWIDDRDGPPSLTGDDPVCEAIRRGDPVVQNDRGDATDWPVDGTLPASSLLAVPIDDHGVLVVGSTDEDGLTGADVDRCKLLTVNAAAAFDRLERTLELQRYETLFETVQDKLYVVDEEGYVQTVSESLADAVGYGRETLRGRHLSTFLTEATAREIEGLTLDLLVTPEDVNGTHEGTLVARDGTETPVEIEVSVLPHGETFRGTAGVIRDISERRQREGELRLFRTVLTGTGIGLAMYGADGRFDYVNDNYAALLGYTRAELEGKPVWETVESLDREGFEARWASLTVDETETRESTHRRADGSTVPVEVVTTAVDIDGTRSHAMTVQDITDRQERRQQTQALHRIFRHNLRNDLTVVRGYATVLTDELPPAYETEISTIADKTEQLIDLTETATEARQLLEHETTRRPVDATTMVQRQVAGIRSRFDATVEMDLPDETYVRADSMLGTAVENLLTNAIEHNDSSSPRVWVRVGPATAREGWVAIEVADNGPGIPSPEQATLAAGEERPLQHSLGLGLWIVRWIVSRYGGELTFHDRNPRGSRVRIALPVAAGPVESKQTDGHG